MRYWLDETELEEAADAISEEVLRRHKAGGADPMDLETLLSIAYRLRAIASWVASDGPTYVQVLPTTDAARWCVACGAESVEGAADHLCDGCRLVRCRHKIRVDECATCTDADVGYESRRNPTYAN